MTEEIGDILGGQEPAETPQVEPETPVETGEQPVEAAEEQPKAEEPQAAPEPSDEPVMVPLKALQEVRDDNRQLRQILEGLQRQPEQPKAPDFLDPEGAQFMEQRLQQMQFQMGAKFEHQLAVVQHGADVVSEAYAAAEKAGMVDVIGSQPDAWNKLVQWHKREKIVAEVGDDPDAYRQKIEADVRKKMEAEMVAKNAAGAQPAPSLAGATSATTTGAPPLGQFTPASLGELLK